MSTIEVRSQLSLDELLNGVAQLETPDLERFVSQVLTLRAQRTAPCLPEQEAGLLEKINQGLSLEVQQRYDDLTAKRRTETLTSEEHQELLTLIDRVERADAERAQALADLARLRKMPLATLMDTLGIHPPDYA
jgi:hypothetical protein